MPFPSSTDVASPAFAVALLGNDAVLAARPATPVQLAHACLQAGYQAAIPASWGDELVATECERQLTSRGRAPAIQCSCPYVAARLLASGGELTPFLVALVPPPVAAARYLRLRYGAASVHITYVGECPGAVDESIDARFSPADFLDALARLGIHPARQPLVFDSVIPPDRRRHVSLPGGLPSPERLWQTQRRTVVELEGEGYLSELAQHLVAGECVLLDVAPRLACACSGAVAGTPAATARRSVMALEPPRAPHPPVDTSVDLQIARALPVLPLAPMAPVPLPSLLAPDIPVEPRPAPPPETRARAADVASAAPRRRPSGFFRTHTVSVPQTRRGEGRALPRAYVARRHSPIGLRTVTASPPPPSAAAGSTPSTPGPTAPAPRAPAPPAAKPAHAAEVVVPVTPVPASDQRRTQGEERWAPPPRVSTEPVGRPTPEAMPPGPPPTPPITSQPAARGASPTPPRSVPPARGRPTPRATPPVSSPRTPTPMRAPAVPAESGGGARFVARLLLLLLAALAGGAVLALLVDRYAASRRAPAPTQRSPRRGAVTVPSPAPVERHLETGRPIPTFVEPGVAKPAFTPRERADDVPAGPDLIRARPARA